MPYKYPEDKRNHWTFYNMKNRENIRQYAIFKYYENPRLHNEKCRAIYHKNIDKRRAYDKNRYNQPHRIEYRKKYAAINMRNYRFNKRIKNLNKTENIIG